MTASVLIPFRHPASAPRNEADPVLAFAVSEIARRQIGATGDLFPAVLPVFEDTKDNPVDLNRLFKGKRLILSFILGGWSAPCVAALQRLEAMREKLQRANTEIAVITSQAPAKSAICREELKLGFFIGYDHNARFARTLGLDFHIPTALRAAMRAAGQRLSTWNGDSNAPLPLPVTVLYGEDRERQLYTPAASATTRDDVEAAIESALSLRAIEFP